MVRSLLIVVGVLFAALLFAQPTNPEPPAVRVEPELDLFPEMTRLLQTKTVKMDRGLKGTTLKQLLDTLEEQCDRKIRFVVREDLFRSEYGPDGENILERQFTSDTNPTGMTLHEFLRHALYDLRAAYLVRTNRIEITTIEAAARHVGGLDSGKSARLDDEFEPFLIDDRLVSGVFQDKSLADVLAEWEKVYEQTISVSGFADITAKNGVSARLMNVPLPTAIELLAAKLSLVAVQKDGAIMVTTADHAKFLGWQPLGKSVVFRKRNDGP